ncbi:hypothetical protein Lser_V15G00407 [Lactuca serriola]
MVDSTDGSSSFWTQANALFRKNLTFQRRNFKTNLRLVLFPVFLCLLLVSLQYLVNIELDKPSLKCGCTCIDQDGDGECERVCGIEYSDLDQVATCSIPSPPEWPPLLQVPAPQYRAVRTDRLLSFGDLPNDSCTSTGSCFLLESSSLLCAISVPSQLHFFYFSPSGVQESREKIRCVEGQHLWRNRSSDINNELYAGYKSTGNSAKKINEILAGYDFLNSNVSNYNAIVWYNSTYKNDSGNIPLGLVRVPRSINWVSNAFLQLLLGSSTQMLFDFVKEMPKPETKLRLDFSYLLGPLFFTWVILQLFPIVLTALVYEKQQNLRIMMKMHGLGDGPYWMISYTYFLAISLVYMLCFVVFGSVIGLKLFTLNDYSIQFVFYFIYINLQISLAFLVAALFSNVKTAAVVGYIIVFATGLVGTIFFQFFLEATLFPKHWIVVMELYPGLSLYGGLYDFSQYAFTGNYMGTRGMSWGDLNDDHNGMGRILIIMIVEWVVVFFIAYYIDQVLTTGSGAPKNPLFFLHNLKSKPSSSFRKPLSSFKQPSLQRKGSKVYLELEKPDVVQERERVEQLVVEQDTSHDIVCDDLIKVYPGRDGNPEKIAVRGLSLALSTGECFGMLGPNGAGKTSFINMMIGLVKPSSGTAYVRGLDIRSDMGAIYANMGVCPQHEEHLLFYGRLKNLKGTSLTQAVEESLKSVNLFNGGVADKQAGKYSGGMKRRLSVAISLIGDPKVVYMDEPSTGLDPASRNNLWNLVKRAKQNRAIILTSRE